MKIKMKHFTYYSHTDSNGRTSLQRFDVYFVQEEEFQLVFTVVLTCVLRNPRHFSCLQVLILYAHLRVPRVQCSSVSEFILCSATQTSNCDRSAVPERREHCSEAQAKMQFEVR